MKVFAIIPSGGKGLRTSSPLPKQYLRFKGKELIAYTIDLFQQSKMIDEIIVSAQRDFFPLINEIKIRNGFTKMRDPVEGGSERQYSVFNAVKSLNASGDDIIVVHDAVRPFLSEEILENSINTAMESGSAVVAIKAKDTLIKGNSDVDSYLDRNQIYYVQTPQVFRYNIFIDSIKKAEKNGFLGTDESMIVYNAGFKVKIVEGSSFNFKITSDDDLKLFGQILK
ncbi:MAG TPA: 2-C-methyl-D-erythritol 4-phosphate cytidylyltransferase [Melioribacteraceae bacterium]|nr:2-C-methyl-D-erythritol 4-phosphate cytidylyltransferase [Melioribacteraceae bacterium]